jgi:putative tricarboxylic transport membrane protein
MSTCRSSAQRIETFWRIPLGLALLASLLLSACIAPPAAQTPATGAGVPAAVTYPTTTINIMAPASPGGGWDQTARAMQTALSKTTGQNVQVYNVPGAGGTVGLAQFVNDAKGDPHQLMVGGMVMVGAIQTNKSPVTLDQVTPLASLTSEAEAIAVAADSKYESLQQLIDDFKADPTAVSWGGGSAGGTDHILIGLIAKAVDIDPAKINYIAYAGGGEAKAAILSGAVSAGVSGVGEFRDQVEAGAMRFLAVSSDQPIEGVDAPTIKESGIDVVLYNWRSIFGPGDMTPEQRDAVVAAIQKMHDSAEWQEALTANGWSDFFQTGDDFANFLKSDRTRIEGILREVGLVQ